ncbi:DoxX family protein [Companilactobacillus metriopterae]|uniref:DoxX family protein n=1 Tax=Companilactobacillus metriopterae TaxID=1909267 RepID=UPI00100AD1BE|nr:DoxX family protein [Companilactobacillus metriopterae]
MIKFLRTNRVASGILAVLRIYLGVMWTMSGYSKIASGNFNPKGMFMGTLSHPVVGPTGDTVYPWFNDMIKNFFMPHANAMGFMVSWGELLVGLGLIFGCLTTAAAFFGMLMNFTYLLSGSVSVNPTFILIEFIILAAGFNAGKIGLDRWIIPYLREKIPFLKHSVQ